MKLINEGRGQERHPTIELYLKTLFCVAGEKKRKACSPAGDSPSKKTKLINDGVKNNTQTDIIFIRPKKNLTSFNVLFQVFVSLLGTLTTRKKLKKSATHWLNTS